MKHASVTTALLILLNTLAYLPINSRAGAADKPKSESVDDLLRKGKYAEIEKIDDDPHQLAAWAFAQYHLAPSRDGGQAAKIASDQGDQLGKFVLMLCHRTGAGVKSHPALAAKLNFELRKALSAKKKPIAFEYYLLSHTLAGDEKGRVVAPKADGVFKAKDADRQQCAQWLKQAEQGNVAQAHHETALQLQENNDLQNALPRHAYAGHLGLAAGNRYAGVALAMGNFNEKATAEGVKLTRNAIEAGGVYAMINLAAFFHHGNGVKGDDIQAQKWIEKAAATRHWTGYMEQGMMLLGPHYGFKKDEEKGKQWLGKAITSGYSDTLLFIARANSGAA